MRILVPRTDYVYVDTYHQGVISMRIHDMYNDMIGFLLTRMALCSQRETENPCLHVPRCCSQWSGDECGPRTHANSWVLSKVGFRQFQGLFLEWKSGSFCTEGARMAVVRFFFESNHSACMKLLVSDLWDHAQKVYCRSIEPHITDLYSDYECWVAPSPAPSIAVASKVLKKIQEVETEVGDSGFLVCHIGIDR